MGVERFCVRVSLLAVVGGGGMGGGRFSVPVSSVMFRQERCTRARVGFFLCWHGILQVYIMLLVFLMLTATKTKNRQNGEVCVRAP